MALQQDEMMIFLADLKLFQGSGRELSDVLLSGFQLCIHNYVVYSLLNPRSVFDISITSKLNIHKLVKYYQRFTQAPLSAFAFR